MQVFLTVDAVCNASGQLQPGGKVLVHAAAGGVGVAAVQLVQAMGGSVVATAGSAAKRQLVRSMGARATVNSRDTSFVEVVGAVGSVDLVLNSLTGE